MHISSLSEDQVLRDHFWDCWTIPAFLTLNASKQTMSFPLKSFEVNVLPVEKLKITLFTVSE